MTPAVQTAKRSGIKFSLHEYEHAPDSSSYGFSYGTEAAEKLGVSSAQVFKTLVVSIGDKLLAVAVLPVSAMLNTKKFARALGVKKAQMADPPVVERSTGYVLGGVSPLGQKKQLKTLIDISATSFPGIYISAGRRGLEIELAAHDLATLTRGEFADICK